MTRKRVHDFIKYFTYIVFISFLGKHIVTGFEWPNENPNKRSSFESTLMISNQEIYVFERICFVTIYTSVKKLIHCLLRYSSIHTYMKVEFWSSLSLSLTG